MMLMIHFILEWHLLFVEIQYSEITNFRFKLTNMISWHSVIYNY